MLTIQSYVLYLQSFANWAIQNRKADWVIFHEILQTGEKTFIRDITKIEKNYLLEYAPNYYQVH